MFFATHKILKVIAWAFLVLFGLYIIIVAIRVVHFFNLDKINAQVEKIHNTKLTLDDVMGKNLPPDPGTEADKTVQGIDANNNGIRDDVELAVFKAYPNSAKTRAVLLQYALALQMEVIQPMVNKETVTAVAEETSRGYSCIGDVISRDNMEEFTKVTDEYINFIEKKQLNTEERKKAQNDFYNNNLGSFELQNGCNINLNSFKN